MPWPEPVERVAAFLRAAGAESRLEQLGAPTATAQAAAEAVGCELDQIVKSLVFVCDGRPVLALVPGTHRAGPARIGEAVAATETRVAKADEVLATTGFEPGGVSPFPPPPGVPVLVDRRILSNAVVWVGAGSERHLALVTPLELLRLTRGTVADIVQEGEAGRID
jgi:prolyl-tRNA editing enzyme YbaK/EbsC (Cys-tRNA(Pro) deacylase)